MIKLMKTLTSVLLTVTVIAQAELMERMPEGDTCPAFGGRRPWKIPDSEENVAAICGPLPYEFDTESKKAFCCNAGDLFFM
jgi:hypothetical protein